MTSNIIKYQIDFWNSFAKDSFKQAGAFVFTTGIKSPLINLVILEQQNIKTLKSILPVAQAFFDKHNVPWGINVIDNNSGKEIISFLENNDFTKICTQFEMETKLDKLPSCPIDRQNIKQVTDTKMLRDWTIPIASGFEAASEDADLYYQLLKKTFDNDPNNLEHFILYNDNKPISSSTLTINNNIARLDNVATIKEKQKQGFGRKIINYSIEKARDSGAEYIIFESSEAGIKLYKKMGFIETDISYIYSLSKNS